MLPDRVSNPGPLTYESGALPIALSGPAKQLCDFLFSFWGNETLSKRSLLLEVKNLLIEWHILAFKV